MYYLKNTDNTYITVHTFMYDPTLNVHFSKYTLLLLNLLTVRYFNLDNDDNK